MKRKKPFAASSASKKYLEAAGYVVADVEKVIPHTHIKLDLLGFGDLIAFKPGSPETVLIQTTGGAGSSNAHARIAKIKAEPRAAMWLTYGRQIWVHHWQAVKGQKERKLRAWSIVNLGNSIGAIEV